MKITKFDRWMATRGVALPGPVLVTLEIYLDAIVERRWREAENRLDGRVAVGPDDLEWAVHRECLAREALVALVGVAGANALHDGYAAEY